MTVNQFIIDLIRRFASKTPKFYQYVQTISLIVAFIAKIPDFANQIGWHVPVTQEPYKTIMITVGVVGAFLSQLAVSDDSKLKPTINTK